MHIVNSIGAILMAIILILLFVFVILHKWIIIYIKGKHKCHKRGFSVLSNDLFFMHQEGCFTEDFFDGLKLLKQKSYFAPIYDLCMSYKVPGFSFEKVVRDMDFITEHKLEISLRQLLQVQRCGVGDLYPYLEKCIIPIPVEVAYKKPEGMITIQAQANFVFPNVAYGSDEPDVMLNKLVAYIQTLQIESWSTKESIQNVINRHISPDILLDKFSIALSNLEIKIQPKK